MLMASGENVQLTLSDSGAIASLRAVGRAEVLVTDSKSLPAFQLQYIDGGGNFRQLSSHDRRTHGSDRSETPDETVLHSSFLDLGGVGIDVDVTVRCPRDEALTYWSLSLRQPHGVVIADVQFPFVVAPYDYEAGGPTKLLIPMREGRLHEAPRPEDLEPDHPSTWQFLSAHNSFDHYPGTMFAQFLAYYNDSHGIYIGCHDTRGAVKNLKAVHHPSGLRLGVSHVVGWSEPGSHELGYEVAVGVFDGDWHTAADLYRDWYEEAAKPTKLADRADAPAWILDSPVHVILRAQGEVDSGPAPANAEVVPYPEALPLLDAFSENVKSAVLPVVMSWEGPGPWVYPESFPVVGGDDSMRAFTQAARDRGWHVGTYCNGTQWVTEHKWTGYDGGAYYAAGGGERTVCRTPDGSPWRNDWDAEWRTSYTCCAAVDRTQELARDYVGHLLDLGFDWVQFFDQNCGAAAFPCYSHDHGHPPAPGRWMTHAMDTLFDSFDALAAESPRDIVFSVESAPNDYAMPRFHICDIRPDLGRGTDVVPLYQYLFHEYVLTQAAFAPGPNPYWMEIKTASSFALGDVLTAILGREGRLINWSGTPWARWDSPAGDQEAVLTLLRRASAMRRGPGKDFLVLGRLLGVSPVDQVGQVQWTEGAHAESAPAVMHAAWAAHDGRTAVALANWTREPQNVRLAARQEGDEGTFHLQDSDPVLLSGLAGGDIELPPLAVALLEWPA
jgi:hypothetical protein